MKKNELLKNVKNGNLPDVYKITQIENGKVYIGQTSTSINQRLEQHIKNIHVDEESKGIDSAIKKFGPEKFKYETLVALPEATTEQLWFLEAMYIEQYNSKDNGFNKTIGNHKGSYDALDSRNKHKVSQSFTKLIEKEFRLDFRNKRVLLIGNFNRKFVNSIEYNDCEVIAIDTYEDKDFLNEFNEVMSEMGNKKFDIVLSNPPYGKIGRDITRMIIETIQYEEFINVLPINDYRRAAKNLYQHVDITSMKFMPGMFSDAAVDTSIAKIKKHPSLFLSKEEFEVESFTDDSLKRYFYENINNKTHYAMDYYGQWTNGTRGNGEFSKFNFDETYDVEKSIIMGFRDCIHNHLPFTKDTNSYRFNVEKSINSKWLYDNLWNQKGNFGKGQITYSSLVFDTEKEKDNFAKFMYSEDGFRFISKVFTACITSRLDGRILLPKVDWTKSWTVEEILKDYGYSDSEIKEVMDDLKNFKGMDK